MIVYIYIYLEKKTKPYYYYVIKYYNKNILKMIRRNIYNNTQSTSQISNTNNNKFFKFIIKGNTNNNIRLLNLSSSSPINISIKGHSKTFDIYDTHITNNFISDDIEYVSVYKKDELFTFDGNYNNCIIEYSKLDTEFYYYIEMFSESIITYTSYFSIVLI
jgi:hypothetical protein